MLDGVLRFHASWCGPCIRIEPDVVRICEKNNLQLQNIDADDDPEEINTYNVKSLPTIIYLFEGKIYDRTIGAHVDEIETKAQKLSAEIKKKKSERFPTSKDATVKW